MTTLQSISSARAETFRIRTRRLLAALGAVAAMLLPAAAAATNGALNGSFTPGSDRAGQLLPLPPIPYLESMQWMDWRPSQPLPKIDTLLAPGAPDSIFQVPSADHRALQTTS